MPKPLQQLLDDSLSTAGPVVDATFGPETRRLSAEQFRDFWRSVRMFAVATRGKSGAPNIAPVHVILNDNDELEMAIFEQSARLRDLRRDPRVAITSWADDGRIAIIYGRATEVPDSRREINRGAGAEPGRYIIQMKIEMTRAYAMDPSRARREAGEAPRQ